MSKKSNKKMGNYKNVNTKLKEARMQVATNKEHYIDNDEQQSKAMVSRATKYGMDVKTLKAPAKLFRLGSLKFGIGFQRPNNKNQVNHIRDNFDPVFAIGITVWVNKQDVYIDGELAYPKGNYIMDGEHRADALLQHPDYGPDAQIWCNYFDEMTYQEAAYYFAHQHDFKRSLTAYDKIKAEKESGNKNATELISLLEKNGITPNSDGAFGIKAMSTIKSAFRELGVADLNRLLHIISSSFAEDEDRFAMDNIKAMKVILKTYRSDIDDKRLIEVMDEPGLYKRYFMEAKNTAYSSKPSHVILAEKIVDRYNYRKVKDKLDPDMMKSMK